MSERSSKKPKRKNKPGAGRPEKYTREQVLAWEPEFLEKAADGMSERAFLGSKGVHRTYLDERIARDIPELSDIKEKARSVREEYYRKLIIAGSVGKIKGFQLGGFVWLTKHLLGWWDQAGTEIEASLGGGGSNAKVTFKSRFAFENEGE